MKFFSKKNNKIIILIILFICIIIFYLIFIKIKDNSFLLFDDGIENNNLEDNIIIKNNDIANEVDQKNNIVIHISGSVIKEGIIKLEEGSRIDDAIKKAGGLKDDADISNINLAFLLSDGCKIYIPSINDKKDNEINNINNNQNFIKMESGVESINEDLNNSLINKKININNASYKELEELPGIGEATAKKIIDYRDENGKFEKIEDLKKVKGVGSNKYDKIKDLISIK